VGFYNAGDELLVFVQNWLDRLISTDCSGNILQHAVNYH